MDTLATPARFLHAALRIFSVALLLVCVPAKAASESSSGTLFIVTNLTSIVAQHYEDVSLKPYEYAPLQRYEYTSLPITAGYVRLLPNTLPIIQPAVSVRYGPFRLVSEQVAEMVGAVDASTPRQFRDMMGAHPGIRTLDLLDVPGTVDDDANLALARMVRERGIGTYVPANGSVRSGGVELFAAGKTRIAAPGAEFVVHSWRDARGYEANHYPMSDPVHQGYIRYYKDMGLSADNARAFYALTNSVSNARQRVVTLAELKKYKLID